MGKKRTRNLQFMKGGTGRKGNLAAVMSAARDENRLYSLATGKINNGLGRSMDLAKYQLEQQKKVREMMAINKEVNQLCIDNQNWVADEYTNWDYGAAALALHRKYGKDANECAEFLGLMQQIAKDYEKEGMTSSDIWDVVRDEIGLDIEVE